MKAPIFGVGFGVPGPTVFISARQSAILSDPRPFKFVDTFDIKASMRLGWSAPIVLPAAPGFEIPDNEAWGLPAMADLRRRPFMERQARIHALWMLGWRKEAQRIYWKGKLKQEAK